MSEAEVLDAMHEVAPRDWWRFVGCRYCNARIGEPCRQGGDAWPLEARQPHAARYRTGLTVHGVLWLIRHHSADLFPKETR